jgi:hypothetical protein
MVTDLSKKKDFQKMTKKRLFNRLLDINSCNLISVIARSSVELEFVLTPIASNWHLYLPQGQASAYKDSSIDH